MGRGNGIDLTAISDIADRASDCPVQDPSVNASDAVAVTETWIQQQTAGDVVRECLKQLNRYCELWCHVRNIGDVLWAATVLAMQPDAMRHVWQQKGVEVWNWAMTELQARGASVEQKVRDLQNTVGVLPGTLKEGDRIVVDNKVLIIRSKRERWQHVNVVCIRFGTTVTMDMGLRQEVQLVLPEVQFTYKPTGKQGSV